MLCYPSVSRPLLLLVYSPLRPSNMLVALRPPEKPSGFQFTTTSESYFACHLPTPETVVPLAKERRRRLVELTEQAFPDGEVPDRIGSQERERFKLLRARP